MRPSLVTLMDQNICCSSFATALLLNHVIVDSCYEFVPSARVLVLIAYL